MARQRIMPVAKDNDFLRGGRLISGRPRVSEVNLVNFDLDTAMAPAGQTEAVLGYGSGLGVVELGKFLCFGYLF